MHTCPQDVEQADQKVKVCPQLHSKCDASLGHIGPCQKEIKIKKRRNKDKERMQCKKRRRVELVPRARGCCEEHDLYFDSLLQSLGWLHLSELASANNEEPWSSLSVAEHSF